MWHLNEICYCWFYENNINFALRQTWVQALVQLLRLSHLTFLNFNLLIMTTIYYTLVLCPKSFSYINLFNFDNNLYLQKKTLRLRRDKQHT